jgi:predicted Fe-Mo cluster-binding NifX family protein
MRVVVTASGTGLDATASPVFGRCPMYVFVDTETMEFETLENPAISAPGGAGIQAAQFVVEHGAHAVLTGNTGPNAFNVLQSANVPVYLLSGGTVREAVKAHMAGELPITGAASAQSHAGMPGWRMGRRRGTSRGMGAVRGRRTLVPPAPHAPIATFPASGEEEVAELKNLASQLRSQLDEVVKQLDRLEEGG